jgi:hypothetical protein
LTTKIPDRPFTEKFRTGLSQIITERNNPVADVVYYSVNFGKRLAAT